ncbi:hypothetical protein EJ06DRAFT_86778 [Trichodelitschia bisporula]|uniref:Uncharacterized protein n=1 Tax=Trichodelitschia bisporula TaxID=703511 RepID=A0A6G1HRM8_9PEZI|nr:hypothetical protein EJ06DRAFT_86778 [Trichodelitschia bisporula]
MSTCTPRPKSHAVQPRQAREESYGSRVTRLNPRKRRVAASRAKETSPARSPRLTRTASTMDANRKNLPDKPISPAYLPSDPRLRGRPARGPTHARAGGASGSARQESRARDEPSMVRGTGPPYGGYAISCTVSLKQNRDIAIGFPASGLGPGDMYTGAKAPDVPAWRAWRAAHACAAAGKNALHRLVRMGVGRPRGGCGAGWWSGLDCGSALRPV